MNTYQSLLSRVRMVRRKWRMQALVRGVSLLLAATVALLVLGVWGADLFGFKPAAVWAMRVIIGGSTLYIAYRFFVAPLLRRVSDVQVAQYIEEHYPQLQDRLVTAVELGEQGKESGGMLHLLVRDALENVRRMDFSVFVDRRRVATYAVAGGGSLLALLALLNWGPSFFPYGFDRLYVPWAEASSNSRSAIMVVPGNADMAKGADQQIKAQLVGFDSPDVRLLTRSGSADWSSFAMQPEPRGSGFMYLLIDVQGSVEYYVEANGIRSPEYRLNVVDLPRVEKLTLTYHFPAYTGMAAQTVEGEGDISGLKGTKITVALKMSQAASSARLLFDNQSSLDLPAGAGGREFTGSFPLSRSGSYVIQLAATGGRRYPGSPEYEIEVVEDVPPTISITKPMRDLRATNVEEVFSELKSEDDIGMGKLELHFSVNGGEEKALTLYNGKPSQQAVTAAHTFFLEEFGLQPGDVVSYYGKATDNNNVTGPGTSSTDIYFIQIRPFEQKYTQSQQGGMPGGGDSGQEALSRQQKDIISATFKLIRDKDKMEAKEYLESLKSLALVQNRLQAQTQGVVDRLTRRGAADSGANFVKLAEYLVNATTDMGKAGVALGAQKPNEALPHEQKALQQLMRAESLFREIQVSFSQSSGGEGGSQANAEDLADLFELELNKLKNQYETVQRGERQTRDQKIDEAMQRLKELAQRQQQLNERNRMMAGNGGNSASSSSGGSQSQQQLMDETEKLQRQLQRLSRERSSPELNGVSSQLQKAIEEMKKALDRNRGGTGQEGSAQGIRALEQLDQAKRTLARGQDQGLAQGMDRALEESQRLLEEQKKVEEGIDGLSRDKQAASSPEGQRKRDDIIERKNVMAGRVKGLGSQIEELSRQARKDQKEASARLGDAAGIIRDKRLAERIQSNNQLLQGGYYDPIKGREEFIRGNLEELARQLESAKGSLGQSPEGKLEEAVNRARQLAEGLESMQQRLSGRRGNPQGRDGRSQDQGGRQGSPGEPGHPGDQGQPGEGRQAQSAQGSHQGGQKGESPSPGGPGVNPSGGSPGGRSMTGDAFGPPTGVGRYTDEDIRQLRRETQQRMTDAQELKRLLDRNPTQMKNLEQVIGNLRNMDSGRNYSNPEQVARLKGAIDLLRQVELDLNRDLSRLTQKDKYFYSDDSEAPSSYKRLVEEYYKALAKGKQQ